MASLKLSTIVVTGASGFIGRYFLEGAKEKYRIFAIARRSQTECNAPRHQNIEWYMVDICEKAELNKIINSISKKTKIDFILHLAGYYDFECLKNPEYERTNVQGTRNILEHGKKLKIKRFIFSSSLTVSDFKKCKMPLTEKSPPNGNFPYALSKRKGEDMLKEYSKHFPCTVIRFAAVFSDWCEYGPLYSLMSTWVSGKWNSRILGGKGKTAITYIHIKCAVLFILQVLTGNDHMKRFDILIASSSEYQSHRKLFLLTTRLYFGKALKPIFIPKFLAGIGIYLRCMFGKIFNKNPFEKIWMVNYIDHFISTKPDYSLKILPFSIRERYHLPRRLIYLIENMKSFPQEWHSRNLKVFRRDIKRPNLLISNVMSSYRELLVEDTYKYLSTSPDYPNYHALDPDKLRWYIDFVMNLLMGSVRNSDRHSVISYYRYLASIRKKEGFSLNELKSALLKLGEITVKNLKKSPELEGMEQYLNDQIMLTLEMAADEVDDAYSEIPDQTIADDENGRIALMKVMNKFESEIVQIIFKFLTAFDNNNRFPNYKKKSKDELRLHIALIYKLLAGCVRHNDNISFISYIRYLASIRRKEGFPKAELIDALCSTVNIAIKEIIKISKIKDAEIILESSIRPNVEKVSGEITKIYSESVII
ncbi:MAG: NAD(P)-dependent oxidoreductase [Acidobacteriota bacterium]